MLLCEVRGLRICEFLRARHPVKTAEAVEARTRGAVPAATVKKWLAGQSAPSLRAGYALIHAYGPDFLLATMDARPDWLASARRAERLAGLAAEQSRLDALAAELEACP